MKSHGKSVLVLASGSGTTFEALALGLKGSQVEIKGLIASKAGIGAIDRAKTLGIPTKVVDGDNLPALVGGFDPDLIVLAGYLKKLSPDVVKNYENKIINVHPSLLPKFGGKGMYGRNVHKAVKEAGETESGATVHWVTENYDEGPIVQQIKVSLSESDSVEDIETKVRAAEKELLISAVNKILSD